MKVNYVLCATGSAMMPRIDHAISTDKEEWAIEQCESRVLALFKAGYWAFSLYHVADEENHKLVKTFAVKHVEPEIISK